MPDDPSTPPVLGYDPPPAFGWRADGDDLVLMSKREADSREQLLQLAAQLIAVSTDDRGTLGDRMAQVFPWMLALSGPDREQCAKDLLSTARASSTPAALQAGTPSSSLAAVLR